VPTIPIVLDITVAAAHWSISPLFLSRLQAVEGVIAHPVSSVARVKLSKESEVSSPEK
jgi:hypothetical protein